MKNPEISGRLSLNPARTAGHPHPVDEALSLRGPEEVQAIEVEGEPKSLIVPEGIEIKPSVEKYLRQRQIRLVYEEPGRLSPKKPSAEIRAARDVEATAKSLLVPKGTLVKPAVAEYLRRRQIGLVYEDPKQAPVDHRPAGKKKWDYSAPSKDGRTVDGGGQELFYGPGGEILDHKPETFTHLRGRRLVPKDHPIIVLRGKLDSLTAAIIEAQIIGRRKKNESFVKDLREILEFTRRLLVCEFSGQQVEEFSLLGLNAADLRAHSHDPMKFYGCQHLMTSVEMGPLCAALNSLRTQVREAELVAVTAFRDHPRDDLVRALNRLSSLFYIMMFRYLPPNFKPESSGI